METLLVGAGQVGRAVKAALNRPPQVARVPWDDPPAARKAIAATVNGFLDRTEGSPWSVCWSAGKGVIGAPAAALEVELGYLRTALDALAAAPPRARERGRLALASSAGGIHGGAGVETVTEASPPTPVSDYGRQKQAQEALVSGFAAASGMPCLLARISSVYGPGQDLRKAQGFVSHLCAAMLRRDGFVLTVPPDTIRDFVYSADVGRRLAVWLETADVDGRGTTTVKLLVSGRSTTLHEVIQVVRAVARVPSRITVSPLPRPGEQPLRTRFRSTVMPHLDRVAPNTSLAEGVHRTWQHLLQHSSVKGLPR